MKFQKSHGLGNDFIIVNSLEEKEINYNHLAILLCNRNTGIGADGLIVLLPSRKADYLMRIFNSDGSEAQTCGNGLRCLGKYIYDNNLVKNKSFTLETGAGLSKLECILNDLHKVEFIWVDMGMPVFERSRIPMKGDGSFEIS